MAAPHAHGADSTYSNLEVVHNAPRNTYDASALQVDHTAYQHGRFQPVPVTSYGGAEPKQWLEHDPNSPPTAREDGHAPEAVPYYHGHPGAGPPGAHGYSSELHDSSRPPPTIWGIPRKKFWIIAGVVGLIVVAAAVGGGVGGALSKPSGSSQQTGSGSNNGNSGSNTGSGSGTGTGSGSGSGNPDTSEVGVPDISIASIAWVNKTTGVKQYRVYHQPINQSNLFESKWDSAAKNWQLSQITQSGTESVKKGTPLMAVVGYQNANPKRDLTKTIYYQQPVGILMERNSEDTFPETWATAGFSNRAAASNGSRFHAYFFLNLTSPTVILTTFYQESGAGSLTLSRYSESAKAGGTISNWVPTRQAIDIAAGSPLAAAAVGNALYVGLYLTKADGTLTQHPFDVERNILGDGVDSDVKLPPKTPLAIFLEDTFTSDTLPSCARGDTGAYFKHLILHATPDRKSLGLLTWDCAGGFRADQGRIEKLLKPNRVYLAVSAASAAIPGSGSSVDGQRAYVLYDEGTGRLAMEEWEVPGNGGEWKVMGSVPLSASSR